MNRLATRNWCHTTHNEWEGCTKVSTGCANCCIESQYRYLGLRHLQHRSKATVFVGPMMDWLDQKVPQQWRTNLLQFIRSCPQHTFLLLTKRMEHFTPEYKLDNVQYGVSTETQEMLDLRYSQLKRVAGKTFICAQPLLEPLDFTGIQVDFVAFGGETGHGARIMNLDHLRQSIYSAEANGLCVILKQMGKQSHQQDRYGVEPKEWPNDLKDYALTL